MDDFGDRRDAIQKYGLQSDHSSMQIRRAPCQPHYWGKDISKFSGANTPLEQYHSLFTPFRYWIMAALIVERHPEYAEDVNTFLNGHINGASTLYIHRHAKRLN